MEIRRVRITEITCKNLRWKSSLQQSEHKSLRLQWAQILDLNWSPSPIAIIHDPHIIHSMQPNKLNLVSSLTLTHFPNCGAAFPWRKYGRCRLRSFITLRVADKLAGSIIFTAAHKISLFVNLLLDNEKHSQFIWELTGFQLCYLKPKIESQDAENVIQEAVKLDFCEFSKLWSQNGKFNSFL